MIINRVAVRSMKQLAWVLTICVLLTMACISSGSESNMFGFCTPQAAYISSGCSFAPNGVNIHDDMQFIRTVGGHTMVGITGDFGDCDYLFKEIESANTLHELNYHKHCLSTANIASKCRYIISSHLRKKALKVQVIVAGWDTHKSRPTLYWLDELGSLLQVPFAANGPDCRSILALFDEQVVKLATESSSSTSSSSSSINSGIRPLNIKNKNEGINSFAFMSTINNSSSKNNKNNPHFLSLRKDESIRLISSIWKQVSVRTVGRFNKFNSKLVAAAGVQDIASTYVT